MRWTLRLSWLLLVSLSFTSQAVAQTTPQAPTADIDALRARLRALDDERARIAQQTCGAWNAARSTTAVAAPAGAYDADQGRRVLG